MAWSSDNNDGHSYENDLPLSRHSPEYWSL
jgi:hypothetical protein